MGCGQVCDAAIGSHFGGLELCHTFLQRRDLVSVFLALNGEGISRCQRALESLDLLSIQKGKKQASHILIIVRVKYK